MPLDAFRILDLTRLLPGAWCTLMLADMGADVIKIEEPGEGDPLRSIPPLVAGRSVLFDALNRNKRSLTLDLKSETGRELLLGLVAGADVLVEGNRPGVMERLRLGFEELRAVRPGLVMCSITGYGQAGPLAGRAGHDINYMAVAGALSLTGSPGGPPIPLGVQVADLGGGGAAACGILAALLEVARGGPGRHLDASMTDGATAWAAAQLAEADATGERAARGGWRLGGAFPCYRVYACSDGYLSVGALEPRFWAQLCQALGLPGLIHLQFAEGAAGEAAKAQLGAAFAGRTRAGWEAYFAGLDVCVEPVLELDEVEASPHATARGLVLRTRRGLEVAPAVRLDRDWRRLDAPELGQHTAAVLAELGIDEQALAGLRARGTC